MKRKAIVDFVIMSWVAVLIVTTNIHIKASNQNVQMEILLPRLKPRPKCSARSFLGRSLVPHTILESKPWNRAWDLVPRTILGRNRAWGLVPRTILGIKHRNQAWDLVPHTILGSKPTVFHDSRQAQDSFQEKPKTAPRETQDRHKTSPRQLSRLLQDNSVHGLA